MLPRNLIFVRTIEFVKPLSSSNSHGILNGFLHITESFQVFQLPIFIHIIQLTLNLELQ